MGSSRKEVPDIIKWSFPPSTQVRKQVLDVTIIVVCHGSRGPFGNQIVVRSRARVQRTWGPRNIIS